VISIKNFFRSVAAGTSLATAALLTSAGGALAQQPRPWEINLQHPASPIMRQVFEFHTGLLIVITLIVLFVLALIGWIIVRYNSKANPVPAKTSHNTVIEVLWTTVPVLVLVGIAIPSFSLLFAQYDPARAIPGFDPVATPPMTLKVTGSQWAWQFDYPDEGISIFTTMKQDADRGPDDPRLLAVDNEIVVPRDTVIQLQVTAADVLHAFAMPAFGVKVDAVPGRLNESWFLAETEGVFYGQCSELCGQPANTGGFLTGHAFMPAAIRVVSPEQYAAWAELAPTDLAGANQRLAAMISADAPAAATQVAAR
jgi:cytochrome c oxidase subunit 2